MVTQYEAHPITRDLGGLMTLFPLSRSIDVTKTPPKGTSVQALARTSASPGARPTRTRSQRGEVKADAAGQEGAAVGGRRRHRGRGDARAGRPTPGAPAPLPAAPADGAQGRRAADAAKKPAKARLVVIGTANLASNQFLGAQGNRDFFLNVVSWLAEDESQISVRARDTKSTPIVLSPPQAELVLWLPVAILPGAVVLVGILAVVSRRRRSR